MVCKLRDGEMRDGAMRDRATTDRAKGGEASVTSRRLTVEREMGDGIGIAPTDRRGRTRAGHRPEGRSRRANPKTRPGEQAHRNDQPVQQA